LIILAEKAIFQNLSSSNLMMKGLKTYQNT
jgi:hypothetical protein